MIDLPELPTAVRPELPLSLEWVSTEQIREWRESIKRAYSTLTSQLGSVRSQYHRAGGTMPRQEYQRLCDWQGRAKTALGALIADASRLRQEAARRDGLVRKQPGERSVAKTRYRDLLNDLIAALECDPGLSEITRGAAAQFLDFIDEEDARQEKEAAQRASVHRTEGGS